MIEFAVKEGDVIHESADLLLLKFAQGFYGADRTVAARLVTAGVCNEKEIQPRPGEFIVIETQDAIAPKRVMFLGTPPLRSFSYNEMVLFARRAIEKIADIGFSPEFLTTTVHGTGYGLDGGEALQRLVSGFRDGLELHDLSALRRITFLTLGKRAERILQTALEGIMPHAPAVATEVFVPQLSPRRDDGMMPSLGAQARIIKNVAPTALTVAPTVGKRRVFVAMPFAEEFLNVYEYGIYPAVRNCGFICERVDETHFIGDVLDQIRGGIESADLVIADLTGGRPNVYLEVGYAWGKGIPVVFVAKKGENLHFDVSTQRCVYYGSFKQFEKDLMHLIQGIQGSELL